MGFKQIDNDVDNQISREELSGYLKQQVEAMQQAGGEQAAQAEEMLKDQDKLVEEIFSHEDKDKDGYISHDEFSGPKPDELYPSLSAFKSLRVFVVLSPKFLKLLYYVSCENLSVFQTTPTSSQKNTKQETRKPRLCDGNYFVIEDSFPFLL